MQGGPDGSLDGKRGGNKMIGLRIRKNEKQKPLQSTSAAVLSLFVNAGI